MNRVRCPNWRSSDCEGCRHAEPHTKQDECGTDKCPMCVPCPDWETSFRDFEKIRKEKKRK